MLAATPSLEVSLSLSPSLSLALSRARSLSRSLALSHSLFFSLSINEKNLGEAQQEIGEEARAPPGSFLPQGLKKKSPCTTRL